MVKTSAASFCRYHRELLANCELSNHVKDEQIKSTFKGQKSLWVIKDYLGVSILEKLTPRSTQTLILLLEAHTMRQN